MTKTKKTYFLMTNQKGDFGCFSFYDYEVYKRKWLHYKELGYIDEPNFIKKNDSHDSHDSHDYF